MLGNIFPPEFIEDHINRSLIPGQVFYIFCDFTMPDPKNKYLVFLFAGAPFGPVSRPRPGY